MAKVLRFFTTNWKLKLLAATLAVLLWVVATADQTISRWVSVPVDVVLQTGEHAIVAGPNPDRVQVRFVGPGREFWELAFNPAQLRLVVTDVPPGADLFEISPQMVDASPGLVAQDVRPARVRLGLRALARREVPVRVMTGPEVGRDVALVGELEVTPDSVTVTGTTRELAELENVPTVPLSVSPDDTVFIHTVSIDRERLGGLDVIPAEVEVAGRAEPISEREMERMAVRLPLGWTASPPEVDLHLRGAASRIRTIARGDLTVLVPPDSLPEIRAKPTSVPLRIGGVPNGVSVRVDPARVMIVREQNAPDDAPGNEADDG